MVTKPGGSSVDASVDASISLNVSGHVVRCGHLSGLMMRLVLTPQARMEILQTGSKINFAGLKAP